jgi:hypothetical protein
LLKIHSYFLSSNIHLNNIFLLITVAKDVLNILIISLTSFKNEFQI